MHICTGYMNVTLCFPPLLFDSKSDFNLCDVFRVAFNAINFSVT